MLSLFSSPVFIAHKLPFFAFHRRRVLSGMGVLGSEAYRFLFRCVIPIVINQITQNAWTSRTARAEYNLYIYIPAADCEACATPCLRTVRDGTGIVGSLAYSLCRVRLLCDGCSISVICDIYMRRNDLMFLFLKFPRAFSIRSLKMSHNRPIRSAKAPLRIRKDNAEKEPCTPLESRK